MAPLYFLIHEGNHLPGTDGDPGLLATQVQAELQRILAGSLFAKSPRMCALLRFLVRQMLEGSAARASEYAIGMEVFGRDGARYCPGEDPIVRVQAGRLRRKLAAYYAQAGNSNAMRIEIPLGSYLPRLALADEGQGAALTFQPLSCLSEDKQAQTFTLGLNEELGYRLHREFGAASGAWQLASARPPSYLLEGSVRHDGVRVRTSLRLVDRARGGIAWCEQLDHGFDLPLSRQEQMADACCHVVRQHLGMA